MKHKNTFSLLTLIAVTSCASNTITAPVPQVQEAPVCPAATAAQKPQILWTLGGFSGPESAIWDPGSKTYFVSNVAGDKKDGQGWVSKVSRDGKMINAQWTQGLNAPKGLRIRNGMLWVSDLDQVSAFQTRTAKRTANIVIDGAKYLNDLNFSPDGTEVLVNDMGNNRIFAIKKDLSQSIFVADVALGSPNGIVVNDKKLLIASWGGDLQSDYSTKSPGGVMELDPKTKKITPWSPKLIGHLDGIEMDGKDAVIVTDWIAGKVFRLKKNGDCITLLEGFNGAADISFVPATRTLVVPAMNDNTLTAYKVPKF